jgi:hypothetical protein
MNQRSAVSKINKAGALLVFPINNRPEPKSLWSEFFPKSKMRWEWDSGGDNRVSSLWMLMKRLSDSREVVYSKWYQGRATFFSKELFTSMLSIWIHSGRQSHLSSRQATDLLEVLESDSPLSTKALKRMTDLQGKDNESRYNRGLKELFTRLLAVAYGEVDDGAFPSLAVGATKSLYEELWKDAKALDQKTARSTVDTFIPEGTAFRKFFDKTFIEPKESQAEI